MRSRTLALILIAPAVLAAQESSELRQILQRLTKVEEQNRALMEEVRALRQELARTQNTNTAAEAPAAAEPPVEERLTVAERRIEEQAQSKVEADHRHAVQLTGMLLFNTFLNGRSNNNQLNPTTAGPSTGEFRGGASFRQTVLGLKYQGPRVWGGGQVGGSMYMDFFGGSGGSLNQSMRLRLATVDIAWKNTTLSVGQDKPILSPREPDSLAQVGVSPLTAAGNLWLWQPQARVEQRFHFGENTIARAQFGIFQTNESFPSLPAEYQDNVAAARPAAQGRFELSHHFSSGRAIEIATGFHASQTHLQGQSVPSRIWSLDWMIRPMPWMDFTGAYFRGENVGVVGALRQGVTFVDYRARSVASQGGWAQLGFRATSRLSFNVYSGQQDDRDSDLLSGGIGKNFVYAGNAMYRLGTNLLASFELSQTRTTYLGTGRRLNPHYDLALAYLF
jgi:hypothetical protein